jgi:hypothetical protein
MKYHRRMSPFIWHICAQAKLINNLKGFSFFIEKNNGFVLVFNQKKNHVE